MPDSRHGPEKARTCRAFRVRSPARSQVPADLFRLTNEGFVIVAQAVEEGAPAAAETRQRQRDLDLAIGGAMELRQRRVEVDAVEAQPRRRGGNEIGRAHV